VTYRLEIDDDALFGQPDFAVNTSDTNTALLTDSLMNVGRSIYWRVAAIDSDDNITFGGIPMAEYRQVNVLDAGDANASGMLNGIDVVFIVAYLKGLGSPPEPLLAGNANGDCLINGLDVVYLVNYFKGGPAPMRGDCPDDGAPMGR
jgi:hypothetical protein